MIRAVDLQEGNQIISDDQARTVISIEDFGDERVQITFEDEGVLRVPSNSKFETAEDIIIIEDE